VTNARVSINPDQLALEDAWEHYETGRDCIVQAAEHTKRSISAGATTPNPQFFAMSIAEVDEFFAARLDETDRQACLFLVASAEAALRVDFLQRVYDRKKDNASRAFRNIYTTACNHSRLKVRLDEDILETWAVQVPKAKARVGDLRGALNYRHWLAHGRYWVPKLGRQYDPSSLLRIINELFKDIGLANQ
jgi:hypothetical protein